MARCQVATRQLSDEKRTHAKAVEDLKTEVTSLKKKLAVSRPPEQMHHAHRGKEMRQNPTMGRVQMSTQGVQTIDPEEDNGECCGTR